MTHRSTRRDVRRTPRGLGAVAAILVLVVLAVIAAAVVRLATSAQAGASLQLQATRASLAAQAGAEWGLYQALRNASCASASQMDVPGLGLHVTVGCAAATYNEGLSAESTAQTVTVYTINAVACNSTACPDAAKAVGANYVERSRQVQATK